MLVMKFYREENPEIFDKAILDNMISHYSLFDDNGIIFIPYRKIIDFLVKYDLITIVQK